MGFNSGFKGLISTSQNDIASDNIYMDIYLKYIGIKRRQRYFFDSWTFFSNISSGIIIFFQHSDH